MFQFHLQVLNLLLSGFEVVSGLSIIGEFVVRIRVAGGAAAVVVVLCAVLGRCFR